MSNNTYKKSYDGDYTKTYKDYTVWRKESAERKKQYDAVSKKLNDNPYNKKERRNDYVIGTPPKESERVYADGRSNTSQRKPSSSRKREEIRAYSPTPPSDNATRKPREVQTNTQPTYQETPPRTVNPPQATQNHRSTRNAYEVEDIEDDGNYNHYDYPIEQIGIGRYRNQKTNKELTLDQAKHVLSLAGFYPKPNSSIGVAIFLFIIANIVMPLAAPLVAIGYGVFRLQSKTISWQRIAGNQKFKYDLPATDSELTTNKTICRVIIVIGVIAAFIRYGALI